MPTLLLFNLLWLLSFVSTFLSSLIKLIWLKFPQTKDRQRTWPNPFEEWGRVKVLSSKKELLAREFQTFLVRPYLSLYPQLSDFHSYPHTCTMYLVSSKLSTFPNCFDSHKDFYTILLDPISHLSTLLGPFYLWNSASSANPSSSGLLSILFTQALCSNGSLQLS